MVFAIIILFIICGIQQIILVTPKDLNAELHGDRQKLNVLIKAHYKPMVEEYVKLADIGFYKQGDSGFTFNYRIDGNSDIIYYSELESKLQKLKNDIARLCPCPVKKATKNTKKKK